MSHVNARHTEHTARLLLRGLLFNTLLGFYVSTQLLWVVNGCSVLTHGNFHAHNDSSIINPPIL